MTPHAEAAVMTSEDYRLYAAHEAELQGIDATSFVATLQLESSFNPNAIGDNGTSIGCAQWHLPAHPDISRETALDCIQSINLAAKAFSQGHARWWSAYRTLYGSKGS